MTDSSPADPPRLLLLIGLPGSGKSTFAREHCLPVLSSDAFRVLLADDAADQTVNSRVFRLLHAVLRERLELRRPLTCIDATSLTRAERRPYIEIAHELGAEINAVYFDVPLEVCLDRNSRRDRIVPLEAMLLLASRLEPPSLDEGFRSIVPSGV